MSKSGFVTVTKSFQSSRVLEECPTLVTELKDGLVLKMKPSILLCKGVKSSSTRGFSRVLKLDCEISTYEGERIQTFNRFVGLLDPKD